MNLFFIKFRVTRISENRLTIFFFFFHRQIFIFVYLIKYAIIIEIQNTNVFYVNSNLAFVPLYLTSVRLLLCKNNVKFDLKLRKISINFLPTQVIEHNNMYIQVTILVKKTKVGRNFFITSRGVEEINLIKIIKTFPCDHKLL